ncbi:MAG: hypothetical protein PHF67_03210 [Candidatus Nanoarchaeia archaeon]|nr:hypothetical protein [Candidatus Nanoarchaeia archaeon]
MNLVKNKKAAEKLISVWWFFVLFIIGLGIVLGVMIYYSAETVVKKVEAESLNQRIFDCLVDKGYLNPRIFEDSFDVFDNCGLNREVFAKGSLFYFKVSVYNEKGLIHENAYGDFSFEKNCQITEKIDAERFPGCFTRTMNILNTNEEKIKLVVLTASNQVGEKVSVV